MSERIFEYILPQQYRISDLKKTLKNTFPFQEVPARKPIRCYHDTFDWRLHNKNYLLVSEADSGRTLLVLRQKNTPLPQRSVEVDAMPVFAEDFPALGWRRRLAPLLSHRALLPQLCLHCHCIPLQYLDAQGKLCLQLVIENNKLVLDKGGYRMLGKRIRMLPVKGYDNTAQQVARYLAHDLGLAQADNDELSAGLALLQRRPGDYCSRLDVALEADMSMVVAMTKILLYLLDVMERNEEGVIEDIDSEFLHDFRVAIRRTRSALGQIKGVFDKHRLEPFRNEFAWLGKVTGPTRDIHVYLMKYASYRDSLPKEMHAHLEPLKSFLEKSLVRERAKLARHLNSQHYRRQKKDWRAFLSAEPELQDVLKNAHRPVKDVAGERIWKMFQCVLKDGKAITGSSPAEKLHRLRIDCKKLRYLLEFFNSLYAPAKMQQLIKALKKLQDNLGDFNDLHVQMESLHQFQVQMAAEGILTAETQRALEHLVSHLNELQLSQRLLFNDRFAQFSDHKIQALFKAQFKPRKVQHNHVDHRVL